MWDLRQNPSGDQAGGHRPNGVPPGHCTPWERDMSALVNRRDALKGALSIAFVWVGAAGSARAAITARRQPGDAAAAAADGNPPFAPNAFIRIDADGPVRLVMPSVEMGQGIYTGICAMLAEELEVGMD